MLIGVNEKVFVDLAVAALIENQSNMSQDQTYSKTMTVAQIRETLGAELCEVMFLESARFYRLSREHPRFDSIAGILREARDSGRKVEVTLPSIDSDEIEAVRVAE